eukprot:6190080-Heterocapsa_arctica.AAC.1
MWASLLERMRSCELLRMLFQNECGGGPHDERHQRRNRIGKWVLEPESFLETGTYTGEDRAHRNFPRDQAESEKDAEQIRG